MAEPVRVALGEREMALDFDLAVENALDGALELFHALVPLVTIALQAPVDDPDIFHRSSGSLRASREGGRRMLAQRERRQHLGNRFHVSQRMLENQPLVEDDRERIDVAALVELAIHAERLLRSHVE